MEVGRIEKTRQISWAPVVDYLSRNVIWVENEGKHQMKTAFGMLRFLSSREEKLRTEEG